MRRILTVCVVAANTMFYAGAQTTLEQALLLLQQKNYVAALDICNALLAESTSNSSVLGVRSQIYTAMGRYEQASQDADKALLVIPKSDRAHYAKGEALYYGQKDYGQALQQYEAAISANGKMMEAYAGKARVYMRLQNNKEAMKVVEDAIKMAGGDHPELFYIRGMLNYQIGKYKSAVDDYDLSLAADANWSAYLVRLNRGIANEALTQSELAAEDFTKAIAADPNNAGGYIARGNIRYNLAKYKEAIEDFTRAETLNPDNPVIGYNIGMAYSKNNDAATACRYFQKSCAQGNTNACKMVVLNCSDR